MKFDSRLFMISRLPKLEHLDDKIIDQDERNEAIRMYGTAKKRNTGGRFRPQFEHVSGIMLQDINNATSSSPSTALEATDDVGGGNEDSRGIEQQESSSTETIYYTFEEHINFLVQKFSVKFNEWKESFRITRSSI